MKIAATYDNGNIFQHFGKTEFFKVYEVEDNKVISSEVISSNGTGHGALAGLLADQGISVLICGGIGGGAQAALAKAGIELCSGAQGVMKTDIPAEAVAEDVVPSHLSQVLMSEKPAVHITEEPLTTEHSSILPMTVASHWNSSAEQDR